MACYKSKSELCGTLFLILRRLAKKVGLEELALLLASIHSNLTLNFEPRS